MIFMGVVAGVVAGAVGVHTWPGVERAAGPIGQRQRHRPVSRGGGVVGGGGDLERGEDVPAGDVERLWWAGAGNGVGRQQWGRERAQLYLLLAFSRVQS